MKKMRLNWLEFVIAMTPGFNILYFVWVHSRFEKEIRKKELEFSRLPWKAKLLEREIKSLTERACKSELCGNNEEATKLRQSALEKILEFAGIKTGESGERVKAVGEQND
ncbi:hypothetical protein HQ571_02490 [Candidatus Kuenenbacteria bacterium]|nr:hypothetical protein [Candidatus Kuenenbacteria bacterium]